MRATAHPPEPQQAQPRRSKPSPIMTLHAAILEAVCEISPESLYGDTDKYSRIVSPVKLEFMGTGFIVYDSRSKSYVRMTPAEKFQTGLSVEDIMNLVISEYSSS